MLTRRLALLASTLCAGALPAMAQPRRQARPAGRGKKDTTTGAPGDTPLGPVDTAARWGFIQDFATGTTLFDKQADDEMPPSSMTKLMTIYLVYERLKNGRMRLEDELPVTERAWR